MALLERKCTSLNNDSANPESGDVTTSNCCISFCYLSEQPLSPPLFVLHSPFRCSAMSWLTHLIIHLSESPHHLESGAGALGTLVTVAIWDPVRGCAIYSRPLVRVTWASPVSIRPTPPPRSVLRKWGICLTLKIALRNYTDPHWPLCQCQGTPVFVAKLSKKCAYFMRGVRGTNM